jgi:hypothetical protein
MYKVVHINLKEEVFNSDEELKKSLELFGPGVGERVIKELNNMPDYCVELPVKPPIEFLSRKIYKIK